MLQTRRRFVVDSRVMSDALDAKGFRSWAELAAQLGLHRNTLGNYLKGAPALPEALEKVLLALGLSPGEAIREASPRRAVNAMGISRLLDRLNASAGDCAFVLFGSRARGTSKRFSDYDVGVFHESGIDFARFSQLLDLVADWNENHVTTVQLTNLNSADGDFLGGISEDLRFLTGSRSSWLSLISRTGVRAYEGSEVG